MPAEAQPSSLSRATVRVAVAPLIELGMVLFIVNRAANSPGADHRPWVQQFFDENPTLADQFVNFWGDGDYACGELLLLSWRAGNVLTQDVDHAWPALERAAAEEFDVPPMESESAETMVRIRRKLERLRESEGFRTRYFTLLKGVWAAIEPVWREQGRPTAEAMRRNIEKQLAGGAKVLDVVPRLHFAHQTIYEAIIEGAELMGEVVIVPLGLAGGGSTFYTIPGMVFIGFGPDHERRAQMRREQSEHAARVFKVVSDPTRAAILASLVWNANSITDLANFFELSQPTVSVHVKMLREAGLLESQKVNGQTLYTASGERLRETLQAATDELILGC
ncbi:MAG TPA: metalloregulator ArsR/SmtB family transcription factor [Tepidiformaceae bacterium]|jgi:DNA-binding transcriptional ArsR family regulator|nr:metalloregulator ArsR/SmtB family transcription factor [Tepidiformaceae bacterium]